jgi:hypothetical protein
MTPRQIAEQASNIRSGFGIGRDFTDEPKELVFSENDALPTEEICPECDEVMEDGRCESCNPPGMWDYLKDLSPAERRREESEIRLERNGMGEWL